MRMITEYESSFWMTATAVIVAIIVIGNIFPGEIFMQDQASIQHLLFEIHGLLSVLDQYNNHVHLNWNSMACLSSRNM